MERRIGAILREARARREIELSDVEAATRIRLKYLRAIEAEAWEALPESVYARGFIHTYASFLGLDGERLAEEYRREVEREGSLPTASTPATPPRSPRRAERLGRARAVVAVAGVLAVAALVLAVLPLGKGGEGGTTSRRSAPRPASGRTKAPKSPSATPKPSTPGISVRLSANAEVWVCVLDDAGRPQVDGQILEAGAAEGPFRSGSFTVSFGNGEVTMLVDGREADIPATSSPIGYSIDAAGKLTRLSESDRPTCE